MADPTHDSAALLQPPGPFVPLPVADQMAKAVALLYDVEIGLAPTTDEVVDQLNTVVAAIADSGLMLWVSPIVYFRTECGFGEYLQDVSAHRVSDWAADLSSIGIQVTAPWRRPIYYGGPITDYDGRPGYAWRFFNHFGIDIYDASGGRGVYGLFDGFFPGKHYSDIDDTTDLYPGITTPTSFSVVWDHLATVKPKIGFYLMLNGERVPGKEALVDVLDGVHTFTDLIAGTTYDVSGYLMDRYNQSSTASSVSVTTLEPNTPNAPSDLRIDEKSSTTATLSWAHIGVAAYFNIYRGGILDGSANNVQGIRPFYNFTELSPSTEYSVEVTAVNGGGVESARSAALVFETLIPLPGAPTSVTATNPYSRGFTVAWDPVATATSYTVYVDSSGMETIPYTEITGTSFDVSGNFEPPSFESTRLFTVRVSATNAAGEGDTSDGVDVSTTYVPPKPTGLVASNVTATGFTLSWDPNTNLNITGFEVRLNGNMLTPTLPRDVFTATYDNIISGTYSVAVNASNMNAGTGATSDPITVSLESMLIPDAPTGLTVTNPYSSGFTVSWDSVASATSYMIFIFNSFTGDLAVGPIPTAQTSFIVSDIDLEPPPTETRSYTVRVRAFIGTTQGPMSNFVPVTTTYAPPKPTNLVASNITGGGFTLTWECPTNPNITEFLILGNGGTYGTPSAEARSVTFSGLAPAILEVVVEAVHYYADLNYGIIRIPSDPITVDLTSATPAVAGFTRTTYSGAFPSAGASAETVFSTVLSATPIGTTNLGREVPLVPYVNPGATQTWLCTFSLLWTTASQRIVLFTSADDGFVCRFKERSASSWKIVCDSWMSAIGVGNGGVYRYTLPMDFVNGKTYDFQVINCNFGGMQLCEIAAITTPTEPLTGGKYIVPPSAPNSALLTGPAYRSPILDDIVSAAAAAGNPIYYNITPYMYVTDATNVPPSLTYFASEADTPLQTTNQLIILDAAEYDSSQLDSNYSLVDIAGLTSISTIKTTSTAFRYVSREMIAICIIPPSVSFYAPGGDNSFTNAFIFENTTSSGGINADAIPFNNVTTNGKRTIAYAKFTMDMFSLGHYSSVVFSARSAPSFATLTSLQLTYSYTL